MNKFLEKLYDNIGGKIKLLAKILLCIGVVGALVGAIVMWVKTEDCRSSEIRTYVLYGFLVLIGGALISYINSMFIYGFGELIDATDGIYRKIAIPHNSSTQSQGKYSRTDPEEELKELVRLREEGRISESEYLRRMNSL